MVLNVFTKINFDHGLWLKSRLMKRMPSSNSPLVLIIPFFRKCITRDCGKIPTYPYYPPLPPNDCTEVQGGLIGLISARAPPPTACVSANV